MYCTFLTSKTRWLKQHCKKSWRSSSTPASGDAGPIHTGIEKSFRQPRRKFYYKYQIFSAFFTSAELVRYDYISHVELFRWWPSNLLFTNVELVRQSWKVSKAACRARTSELPGYNLPLYHCATLSCLHFLSFLCFRNNILSYHNLLTKIIIQ